MSLGNGASQTKVEPLDKVSWMHSVSMATNQRQPLGALTLKKQWKLITYHVIDMPRGKGELGCKHATAMNTTPGHPAHQPWGKLLPSVWLVCNLA